MSGALLVIDRIEVERGGAVQGCLVDYEVSRLKSKIRD